MARVFIDTSSEWLSYTSAALASPPCTLSAWFNVDTTTGTYNLITFGGASDAMGLTARGASGGVVAAWSLANNNYVHSTSSAYSSGVWNHGAAVFASSSHRQAWLNGVSGTAETSTRTPSVNRTGIGAVARTSPSHFCDGKILWPAIWDVALSDEEIVSLSNGVSPLLIRPESLVMFAPLGGLDGEHDLDIWGGVSFTANGTPTWSDDSPAGLIYPSQQIIGMPKVSSPIYNQRQILIRNQRFILT